MSGPIYVQTIPITKVGQTSQLGICGTRGGELTPGEYLPNYEAFIYVKIAAAGDVYIETLNGDVAPFLNQPVGSMIPLIGLRVTADTTAECSWIGGAGAI